MRLILSALMFTALALPASAQTPAVSDAERAKIEQVVKDFIAANPGYVQDQLDKHFEAQRETQRLARQEKLSGYDALLYKSPVAPVSGNPDGDVVLVEFFDYRCGYCKLVAPDIERVVEEDGFVKVVHKHLPVLGSASVVASRAALAAQKQGRYAALHAALMRHQGRMDQDTVMALAKAAGLDLDRLEADMNDPAITKELDANREMAAALRIRGTPSFIVGDTIQVGTVDPDRLKRWIGDARKGG